MYCPKCGKKIEDNLNYCPACGAAITSKESKKTATTKTVIKKIDTNDRKTLAFIKSHKELTALGILGLFDIVISVVFYALSFNGVISKSSPQWILAVFVILLLGIGIPEIVFFIKSLVKTNSINQRINNNKKLYLTSLILPVAFGFAPASILTSMLYNTSEANNILSTIFVVLEAIHCALMIYMAVYCFVTSKTIKQYLIKEKLI